VTSKSLSANTIIKQSLIMAMASLLPLAAFSDDVVLKSTDGSINLTGELLDYTDDYYLIRTTLGELSISASRVNCEGESCPQIETNTASVVLAGSDTVGLGMMPLLLTGFASFLNAEASAENTEKSGQLLTNLVGDGGYGENMGSYLVTSSTSGDAFTTLMDKSAHIGMASRRIKPTEARSLRSDGAGNMVSPQQEHIVAVDSLVVIVNPENTVKSITMDQLAGVYSGEITNWSELGGADATINVFDRQHSSGTHHVFRSVVFGQDIHDDDDIHVAEGGDEDHGDEEHGDEDHGDEEHGDEEHGDEEHGDEEHGDEEHGHNDESGSVHFGEAVSDNSEMAAKVFADPHAIGFVGHAFQRGASSLSIVNDCGIQTSPDAFSAKTEEYPLQRRLYMYNRSDNLTDATTDFINYATSSNADGVIAKSGFIDLGVSSRDMDMNGVRAKQLLEPDANPYESGLMREMLRQMLEFDRLSTTFRFSSGSSKMDERGLVDMQRLASYLEAQPEGTTVLFAGFTDSVGPFDSNRALSGQRAAFAAKEFGDFAGDRISQIKLGSAGFGEIAPVACNNDVLGRTINRRVEVWIKPAT